MTTASEKLRALEVGRKERFEAVDGEYADAWVLNTFEAALPQIVAVVEAAGFALPVLQEYSIDADEVGTQTAASQLHEAHEVLYAALSALEEAL